MKINVKKISVMFCLIISSILFNTGFVVFSAANPVSLSLTDDKQIYELNIFLREDTQMNSFQFRLEYNQAHIRICEMDFNEQFTANYDSNKNALLRNGIKDGNPKSSIVFLGVQTDDKAALQKSGTIIAKIKFNVDLTDVGDIVKELDSIILNVEVLEGEVGNIVDGSENWRVSAVRVDDKDNLSDGNNFVDDDDLREDKAYRDNNKDNSFVPENGLNTDTSVPSEVDSDVISSDGSGEDILNNTDYISSNTSSDDESTQIEGGGSLADNSLSDENIGQIVSDTAGQVNSTDVSKAVDKADNEKEKPSYYVVAVICMFVVLAGVIEGILLIKQSRQNK